MPPNDLDIAEVNLKYVYVMLSCPCYLRTRPRGVVMGHASPKEGASRDADESGSWLLPAETLPVPCTARGSVKGMLPASNELASEQVCPARSKQTNKLRCSWVPFFRTCFLANIFSCDWIQRILPGGIFLSFLACLQLSGCGQT